MSPALLQGLRESCARWIEYYDNKMREAGSEVYGLSHLNKRYFIPFFHWKDKFLEQYVFGETMAEICRATIGPQAWLFQEQFVVKGADVGMKFAWHQDGGYLPASTPTYVSCWGAMDDMTVENGTIYVLPYSRAGTREWIQHKKAQDSNDMIGYWGEDQGIPVIVPAGSIVVFSSLLLHCSGANTTRNMRRSYLVQYSPAPVMNKENTGPQFYARRFLKDGKIEREDAYPLLDPVNFKLGQYV
jgi:ectoine hydroxylase-related dioxygenase (phytanoyl-CoA dioxygenase family)